MTQKLITFTEAETKAIGAKYAGQLDKQGNRKFSDDDINAFLDLAERYGLHPLRGQLIMKAYWSDDDGRFNVSYETTLDAMLVCAHRTLCFVGITEPVIDREAMEGHCIVKRITGNTIGEYPGWASRKELYGSSIKGLRGTMPVTMLRKCIIASGMRAAFPLECGALYLAEEMLAARQPDDPPAEPPTGVREVPPAEKITFTEAQQKLAEANGKKPEPEKRPDVTKQMLVGMIASWAACAPEAQLETAGMYLSAKGLRGRKLTPAQLAECYDEVVACIESEVEFADFVNRTPSNAAPPKAQSKPVAVGSATPDNTEF